MPASTPDDLINSFVSAAPDDVVPAYHELVASVWGKGTPTEAAEAAVPGLVRALDRVPDDRRGRLLVLLGVLAQTGGREDGGPVTTAVRAGLPAYLDVLRAVGPDHPDTAPACYLLGQLLADRDEILAATADLGLGAPDATRLERSLRVLDPNDPEPDLGRSWPSPSVWELDEADRAFDRSWISALTPEQVRVNWGYDTDTMVSYAGAKAYFSAVNGITVAENRVHHVPEDLPPATEDPGAAIFEPHLAALRCPSCRGPLTLSDTAGTCPACSTSFPLGGGILDLTGGVTLADAPDAENSANLLQKMAEMPSLGLYYESVLRPAFLRIAGGNFDDQVTYPVEDAYITEHVKPVDGPVLDLSGGTGRWTKVLADAVGHERVVVVDVGLSMLAVLRRRLPRVPAVLASALDLPFADESLGAVNLWNALQAYPEQAGEAIAEVGRCLRPGGTFTVLTFRWADDPIAEYFQANHHFPSRPEGMLLFDHEQLTGWLADGGMSVRDMSGPGSFVFLTAVKDG